MRNQLARDAEKALDAIKARALLIAVSWAGSARALGPLVGYAPATSAKWQQRGFIPAMAALKLARLSGFPLSKEDMAPGTAWERYRRRTCPKCKARIAPPSVRTGSSSMLKGHMKRPKKKPAKHTCTTKSTPRKSTPPAAD